MQTFLQTTMYIQTSYVCIENQWFRELKKHRGGKSSQKIATILLLEFEIKETLYSNNSKQCCIMYA